MNKGSRLIFFKVQPVLEALVFLEIDQVQLLIFIKLISTIGKQKKTILEVELAMRRDEMRFTNPSPVSYMKVGWKNVPVPSLYFFCDKNISQSCPKRNGILRDPIPIGKNFILNRQWDGMGWNLSIPFSFRICPTPVPKFFYWTKICLNPIPNGMGSHRITCHREKLPSLPGRHWFLTQTNYNVSYVGT